MARPDYCEGSKLAYAVPPRGRPAPPVKLVGDQFVKVSDGSPVAIHGINWFGFNNGMTWLNGLWAGGKSGNSDFATIVYELQLLGFNAIRLPYIFKDLKAPSTQIGGYCTGAHTLNELAERTIDPEYRGPMNKQAPQPVVPLPDIPGPGTCNTYIPGGQTIDRYMWSVQWLIANGWYVLIDNHPMSQEMTSHSAKDFIDGWKWVWSKFSCLPNFEEDMKGRLFLDILNEPDSQRQGWQPNESGAAGMTELYLGVMDALWEMTPGLPIFFVEGGGQGAYKGINWGNGFITNTTLIESMSHDWTTRITDANPFFKALMKRPYLDRVVISPHVYGPSVSNRRDGMAVGPTLWEALDTSFGYLNQARNFGGGGGAAPWKGYCADGTCHTFPVAIGEFGSRFVDKDDMEHLRDFTMWLRNEGPGNTGKHRPVGNFFYSNSGDTGGLVKDTWHEWEWEKIRYLQQRFGLKPWFAASAE
ncbi:hypothetical protein MNEG_1745 [Monoraphidium neglectum]|uniref:Glycoside hydrolase family 5 domain-containing protein n=1 Tax=Monoraphidium neglectum TaxID=145388 RepID=A0A0D2LIF9_9CHLO|nr:hypothetical protein MNEG_1745 [Monoraphidium neglectum]KIZ06214.1 hypothetical protein MNEG_1745 [Monoraphidium neglectum]|eukprot:XP_013905233.1 hypothetical protein MNEG_1745 [Monoraphidium neglectum]